MAIDIALILKKILLEEGEVILPGVGLFVLKRSAAVYDNLKNKIDPPSSKLLFDASKIEGGKLHAYTKAYYKLSDSSADSAINSYIDDITSKLSSGDKSFSIQGIGRLYMDNESVRFEESNHLSSWYTKGLLPVVPVIVTKTEGKQSVYQTTEAKDQNWRWLPFLILLCLLTFTYKYYTEINTSSNTQKEEVEIVEKDLKVVEIDTTKISQDTSIECIVITGYFTRAKNVLKMVNKIEALGYEVFNEEIADGTRVGIKFDCTNLNLREKIFELREQISMDAWYLQPPITID